MIFDARRESRRCTMVTFVAKRDRNSASSIAESPPPTTRISLFLKKKPSHVAHVDTPRPRSLRSDSSPSIFADAPVAMISVLASHCSSPELTGNGRVERSIDVAAWCSSSASNRDACFSIASISSGPRIASGKPG